jgi:gas vesicle protein
MRAKNYEDHNMRNDNSITVLLAGVGVGAVAAMLLTRWSGAELRRSLRQQAENSSFYLKLHAEDLAKRAEAAAAAGHQSVGSHLVEAKSAVRATGTKAVDAINSAADAAARMADNLLDQSGDLARRAGKMVEQA